jgi:4-methyl-5(b-hydroxyethyl)-thiazole monophosphate biosynthesis
MSSVCVLLADGFEEIEAITIVDVLRRAEIPVELLGVHGRRARGSHGIVVEADATLAERAEASWAAVVLPGGMPGAATLRDDPGVQALLHRQQAAGGRVAAICAAPIALGAAGLLEGRDATCYPGFEGGLGGARHRTERVVEDGPVITSRGPGTALEFALALVRTLRDPATAERLADGMLVRA